MQRSQQYQLGSWVICPTTNTISGKEDSLSLDNKSMQLLMFFIEHQGETVTKKQIFEHVWKDKFVADDILSVTVSKIRKALGDNARRPTFIKTLPGVGYSLVAKAYPLEAVPSPRVTKAQAPWGRWLALCFATMALVGVWIMTTDPSPTQRLNINSIAVLPFDDLSSAQNHQHLSDGLSDAIIHQLSQLKSLKVISRYSSFTYRGNYDAMAIGQALQVETLLDGSVQKMGDRLRINVRIFSTDNGQQLWSQTFEGEGSDTFQLQDRISASIQTLINPNALVQSESAKVIDAQAYEWFLMGQYHWRQRHPASLEKAVTYFKRSLEIEPEYADAHVGLGITYAFLHTYGNWGEIRAVEAALPHIDKALEIHPDSAKALAAQGLILAEKALYLDRSGQQSSDLYEQAQTAFVRSLKLEENATTHQWYSALLRRMGKDTEAIEHLNKSIELNPLSASLKRSFSFELLVMNKLDSAQRMLQQAVDLEPDHLSRLIESSQINRYSPKLIADMLAWHQESPELFAHCSSIEYCEHMAFVYLSIGAEEMAGDILANMGPLHFHYRTSLGAIAAAERGDDQAALRIIKPFAQWLPNNRRTLFNYAVAQFRAGEYEHAKESLLRLYPDWFENNAESIRDITPDNHLALLLYAATLSKLEQSSNGVLQNLLTFLNQGKVFDKSHVEFTKAAIHAQLGEQTQALSHLQTALNMGWMETYSREWWSLENHHYLKSLRDTPEFQALVTQLQNKRIELRERIVKD